MADPEQPAAEPGVEPETSLDGDLETENQLDPSYADDASAQIVEADVEAASTDTESAKKPTRRAKVILCPYCGHTQSPRDKCIACGGLFEPLSRRATQIAMGPWTVRNKAQPFKPGCSYEVLKKMIAADQIGPTTVLRGPTTRQFWSIARNVPGVAHLLGYCHSCGKHVAKEGLSACPHCAAPFKSVRQRNELGLQFPHRRAAEAAQRTLNRLIHGTPGTGDNQEDSMAGESAIGMGLDDNSTSIEETPAVNEDKAAPSTIFDDNSFGSAAGLEVDLEEASAAEAGADLIDDVLGEPAGPVSQPAAAAPAGSSEVKAEVPPPVVTETSVPPAALPPRKDVNWLVVGLIALNVLVAAAVVAFVATRGGAG